MTEGPLRIPTKMSDHKSHKPMLRYVVAIGAALLLGLVVVAIAFAVEEHNDRILGEELDRTEVELKVLGEQITDIKDADLQSMNDYISAYAQVEHLQSDYDQKLRKYRELYSLARKRDADRGFFNVERFRSKHHPEAWEQMTEIIDVVGEINELTKRETAVIHAMALLPEQERVKFWHEQFAPLAAQEHVLREKLTAIGRSVPRGRVQ
jgi:hypothetical protein